MGGTARDEPGFAAGGLGFVLGRPVEENEQAPRLSIGVMRMLRATLCMRPSVVLVRRLVIGCVFGVLVLSATATQLNRGSREQDSASAEITRGVA